MTKTNFPYLHGFSEIEQDRLRRQARFAEHIVYQDVNFSDHKHILEVGCGVGAQTEILLRRFPEIKITGLDRSEHQLKSAAEYLEKAGFEKNRYNLIQSDAEKMSIEPQDFDGAFLCWILEHVEHPNRVLSEVRRVLEKDAKVYVTEVLNSSFFLEPYSPYTLKYWMAFNDYQYDLKGDPFVGAKLGNLLLQQGFDEIRVETKTWHLDNRRPRQRKKYIDYWSELLLSAADQLIKEKYIDEETVDKMKDELMSVSLDPNAVFYFSLIQASART